MCPSLAEPDSGGIPKSNILHKAMQEWLLEKTIFNVRQKGVPPLLLPASVLQLPRCLVWIYILDSHDSTLFELDSFKKCNCSRKTNCKIKFASQMWAARPHLANIFEKLLDQKTFYFACGSYATANSTQNKTSRPLFQTRICWFFCIKMQLKFSYGV